MHMNDQERIPGNCGVRRAFSSIGGNKLPRSILTQVSMSALALAAMGGAAHAAGCSVTYEDGSSYTDTSVISCTDYYPTAHPCGASGTRPDACATQDMFKAVNWGASQNLLNNVKKGLWSVDIFDNSNNSNGVVQNTSICAFKVEKSNRAPNTIRSFIASYDAGWKTAEVDTALMFDAANYDSGNPGAIYVTTGSTPVAQAYIGHYKDYWAATTWGDDPSNVATPNALSAGNLGYTWNTSRAEADAQQLYNKYMYNHEFQLPAGSGQSTDRYVRAIDLMLSLAGTHGKTDMVMVFDVKAGPPPRPNRKWESVNVSGGNVAKMSPVGGNIQGVNGQCGTMTCADRVMLAQAQELAEVYSRPGAAKRWQANIVIKTRLSAQTIRDNVPNWNQFSWIPLVPNGEKDPTKYLTYVQDWVDLFGDNVLFIDTNNISVSWWQANSFQWNDTTKTFGSGTSYDDVTDFVRKYTESKLGYGLRAQWWPVNPVRPTGNVGSYITETVVFPGRSNDYTTGPGDVTNTFETWVDPTGHFNEKYAAWAVVTHDRPDVYLQHRNQAAGVDCIANGDG